MRWHLIHSLNYRKSLSIVVIITLSIDCGILCLSRTRNVCTTPNTWLEVSVSDILGRCLFPAYLQWYQRITIESVVLVYEAGWALTLDPSQCTNLSGLDFFPFIVRTQYKLQYECGLVGGDIGYSLVVVSRTSIQLSSDLRIVWLWRIVAGFCMKATLPGANQGILG